MNSAPDHAALSHLAPAGTLPQALLAAARDHAGRPALRHKRAGIWHSWSFEAYLGHVAAMARLLDGMGLRAGSVLATVGENRPEFYAAHLAAQALGAAAMPLSGEFLRRFGAPAQTPDLVLCDGAEAALLWQARLPGFSGPLLRLDEIAPNPDVDRDEAVAWLAIRAAGPGAADTALVLHDDTAEGLPAPVALSHAALLQAGRATLNELGLGARDTTLAFLPMSGIADAATSLVQPLVSGLCVHCVEGPATFPLDLQEVAPTYLCAPARVFELLDRSITARLGTQSGVGRALQRLARAGLPGGTLLFAAPLLNALGLSRCRCAVVTGAEPEPGMVARLLGYGVPLRTEYAQTAAGAIVPAAPATPAEGGRCPLAHVEALLRDTPEIERARVSATDNGLLAEIAFDPAALDRFLEANGLPAGEGASALPAVRSLADRAVAAVNAGRSGAAPKITTVRIRPQGFSPAELTLTGEVRRSGPTAPRVGAPAAHQARPAGGPAPRSGGAVLMEIRDVSVAFGGVKALTDVSLDVRAGEILSVIGPNGAGKTSLLNVLNGVYHPRAGTITFRGKTRARMRPAFAARSGIGRTFQHVSLFKGMNVIDNVMVGRAARFRASVLAKTLRLPAAAREESRERAAAERILAFLDLEHLRKVPVATLPYGVQKRVELARALATEPSLLLLDEPMAGMTHEEKADMCGFIRAVNESFGTTILIIEHDIGVVMGLSDRVVVLNYGRKIADGPPDAVRADPDVIAAYLGSAAIGGTAA